MKRYVLTNYTMQCTDNVSGKTGCFLFDLDHYAETGTFKAIGAIYPDLDGLYRHTTPDQRKPCYVEYIGN
jgi:hypothetical protein